MTERPYHADIDELRRIVDKYGKLAFNPSISESDLISPSRLILHLLDRVEEQNTMIAGLVARLDRRDDYEVEQNERN